MQFARILHLLVNLDTQPVLSDLSDLAQVEYLILLHPKSVALYLQSEPHDIVTWLLAAYFPTHPQILHSHQ